MVTIKDKNDNAPQCDATCGQGLTRTIEEFTGTRQLFQGEALKLHMSFVLFVFVFLDPLSHLYQRVCLSVTHDLNF